MSLRWTDELNQIVKAANADAHRMNVRMNTALLLRSMLKCDGPAQTLLASFGLNLFIYENGIKNSQLEPEPRDTSDFIFECAANLALSMGLTEVSSIHVLMVLLRQSCMGNALLRCLQFDFNALCLHLYGQTEQQDYYYQQRSYSQSMNSVAVQRKSPIARPTTYIEPQPAVSFGSDDLIELLKSNDSQSGQLPAVPRKGLLTPGEISQLNRSASQPSLPWQDAQQEDAPSDRSGASRSSVQAKSKTLTSKTPTSNGRTSSSSMRSTSSREMQLETTRDLALRLKEKKSKTSEARRASQELSKVSNGHSENKKKDNAKNERMLPLEAPAKEKTAEEKPESVDTALTGNTTEALSQADSAKLKQEKPEQSESVQVKSQPQKQANPIISRKNAYVLNESGSVYSRKAPARAKLPAGFDPLKLNSSKFPMLCAYGRNLLAEAVAGRIDPVIDREQEIDQLIDILNKRRCNNPILMGEAGVGKTAIIEGLALRMANNQAPRGLENHTIIALDYGSILCGTQLRGAVQERIKAIKKEVSYANGYIILFLDEIHSWLASGSGDPNADAALELKMALSRGELLCIGASTQQELRRAFNSDPAFERRFDFIEVKAPSPETSIRIIEQGIISQYAEHHDVTYEPDAIRQAVRLSERYIQERALPDKAISVLDRAGSLCERSGDSVVTAKHVASVIAQIAEVPVERLLMTEKQKLMKMEEILGRRLIGHEENIARMANVIRRNHAGFGAQRPIGSFLFLGPTGVGKTEAAKVLADYLFGSPKNIVRFDMSEYMEQHSVAKLIGAPAGYVGFDDGGLLTEALRKRPYQIVLFDEIEKAHPDVMNILLQILDEGRLTDAKGRHVDFSNTVIIMTSNLGASEVMRAAQTIGFAGNDSALSPDEAESIILKAARSRFTPELWNRIEEKLIFHPLTIQQIEKIAHLLLSDSRKRLLDDKRVELAFDESALIPYLIQNGGFDPNFGARPMRTTIQTLVESQIAEWILGHEDLPKSLF
ncbi:MAG: AAA family ATPase, partial [Proteobacteria bacterium]|nr:AAA family ATPase [Pseudomonadota bacterium]